MEKRITPEIAFLARCLLVCRTVQRDRCDGDVAFPDGMDIGAFLCILDKRPVDPEIGAPPGVKTFLDTGMEEFVGKAGHLISPFYLGGNIDIDDIGVRTEPVRRTRSTTSRTTFFAASKLWA